MLIFIYILVAFTLYQTRNTNRKFNSISFLSYFQCIIERRLSSAESMSSSFPYPAAPVVYTPPSLADIAEKVAEVDRKSQFSRTPSSIQRKGYTSDEELDEIDSPLASIVDKTSSAHSENGNGNIKDDEDKGSLGSNARYELLREVWRATT